MMLLSKNSPWSKGITVSDLSAPSSKTSAIVGGVIGGVAALLVIILLIVGIYKCVLR